MYIIYYSIVYPVESAPALVRKGTTGVSTNEVTANVMVFDRGTFWLLLLAYFYIPKSARAYIFPQSVKIDHFRSAPSVSTPICRRPPRLGRSPHPELSPASGRGRDRRGFRRRAANSLRLAIFSFQCAHVATFCNMSPHVDIFGHILRTFSNE